MGGATHGESFLRMTDLCADSRIVVRDIALNQEELTGLMRLCDAFVSLHRSEGFGRGPAEAMLLGKPVIVTNYSGNVDFATAACAYTVRYKLTPVAADEYPGVERQRWAEPDVAQAASHMRRIHDNPAEAQRIGELARARIMQLYGPHVVGEAMVQAIETLSGKPNQAAGTVLVARRRKPEGRLYRRAPRTPSASSRT